MIVAKMGLCKYGIKIPEIMEKVFNGNPEKEIQLFHNNTLEGFKQYFA